MPAGDPEGYLPRVKRARKRTKMSSVKGTKIGKVVGKPVAGLAPSMTAGQKPRTFQPVAPGATGRRKPLKQDAQNYRSRAARRTA